MRYILLDRILAFEPGKSIRAVKAIASSEDIVQEHFPDNPVMPGALMIEAAAQAGTALLELSKDCTVKAFLILVHEAKFRTLVRPGETLVLTLTVLQSGETHSRIACDLRSALPGRESMKVATMELSFGIRPVKEFYSEYAQHFIRSMYDQLLRGAEITGGAQ
jgi:3-hydroxymyristoyl/3-hydroxydecanoyl-(acyl carrier protein) dehydratase